MHHGKGCSLIHDLLVTHAIFMDLCLTIVDMSYNFDITTGGWFALDKSSSAKHWNSYTMYVIVFSFQFLLLVFAFVFS